MTIIPHKKYAKFICVGVPMLTNKGYDYLQCLFLLIKEVAKNKKCHQKAQKTVLLHGQDFHDIENILQRQTQKIQKEGAEKKFTKSTASPYFI